MFLPSGFGVFLTGLATLVVSYTVLADDQIQLENALNCPLSSSDTHRYRRIFLLQKDARWSDADQMVSRLDSDLLIGWVLADRYLHKDYPLKKSELAGWLTQYADHPEAEMIHSFAMTFKGDAEIELVEPVSGENNLKSAAPIYGRHFYRSNKRLSHSQYRLLKKLKRDIRKNLQKTHLTSTAKLLAGTDVTRLFDQFELNEARSRLAAAWLYQAEYQKAFQIADDVAQASGDLLPFSHWTAGLAAWHLGKINQAKDHFEKFARSKRISPWNRASGGYWSARAHLHQGGFIEARAWLMFAAVFNRTFYGILARQRLGLSHDVNLHLDQDQIPGNCSELAGLLSSSDGSRAVALVQIGRAEDAEKELNSLDDWKNPKIASGIIVLAYQAKLYHFGLKVAERLLVDPDSGWTPTELDPYLYPTPMIVPENEFIIDKALVYAFIRQESSFDPEAGSHDGALGLMQLLPTTAAALDAEYDFNQQQRAFLFDPELNVTLGQKYLQRLMRSKRAGSDLFHLASAYNAGPGNLGKWKKKMKYKNDPLLFIEGLPSLETRLFVERVMANFWIYRKGLGQETPSLEELALDQWPRYLALDDRSTSDDC